jgi:hypothetical protein
VLLYTQVLLTRRHLAIVMSYEGGGDLHSYARKYTMNEEVARWGVRHLMAAGLCGESLSGWSGRQSCNGTRAATPEGLSFEQVLVAGFLQSSPPPPLPPISPPPPKVFPQDRLCLIGVQTGDGTVHPQPLHASVAQVCRVTAKRTALLYCTAVQYGSLARLCQASSNARHVACKSSLGLKKA